MDVGMVLDTMRCLCGKNSLYEPLCKQCKYLKNPKEKIELLDKRLQLLRARESDVENKLNDEMVCLGRNPKAEVNLWQQNVRMMACSINLVELSEDKRCLFGYLPNYISRAKLGKLVEKKIYEIDELLEEHEKFSEGSFVSIVPRTGWIFPETTLVGETSRRVLETTWNYLTDRAIGKIGVYGMGGVGKTAVAIVINNRLLREKTFFTNVIWVTASKESSIKKLQKDIANKVNLRFEENDHRMTRAAKLLEVLRRKSWFLLIIDDLWEGFSLESIGIPCPEREKICKIIITTRSFDVCHQMETDKEVEVGMLLENEGWELFKQKVGAGVLCSPEVEDCAKSVARLCGGLPLGIITVGRALRKETDLLKWQDALAELRQSFSTFTNMEKLVFSRLRFSYERLSDQRTKSCFLFCALYPKDHLIETEELLNYWIWEGLLEYNSSVKMMRHLGRSILRELKDTSMLESVCEVGSGNEYVKMHDLIRDMAIDLTRETSMTQSGLGMDQPPSVDNWSSQIQTVSLMRNDLSNLQFVPQCPNLGTLLLQYNSLSKGIHPNFFQHMGMLRILDLSFTGIGRLPKSFSNLKKLLALMLRSCWNLKFLPSLAHLTGLVVLDLAYTSITSIPEGMEELRELRHLDLSYTSIKDFSSSILQRYPFLANLLVMGMQQFLQLSVLKKICLETLEISFSTLETFQEYMRTEKWRNLDSFKFCIGYPPSLVNMQKNCIGLFGVCTAENESVTWPLMHELVIHGCNNLTQLPMYIAFSSSELRICRVQYCHAMQWILNSEWSEFPKLERLEIEGLRNLTKICKGIRPGLLARLRILHVHACDKLKVLIPPQLMLHFKNIEEIEVRYCNKIEEIFAAEEEDEEITEVCSSEMVLPSLKKLTLSLLPCLKSICNDHVICDSLSLVEVRYCKELKGLPLFVGGSSLLSSVELIDGNGTWSKHTEDHQGIGSSRS